MGTTNGPPSPPPRRSGDVRGLAAKQREPKPAHHDGYPKCATRQGDLREQDLGWPGVRVMQGIPGAGWFVWRTGRNKAPSEAGEAIDVAANSFS